MIICAGEALIDMLPRQTDKGENAFAPYPGGAVFNTAVALGRLGAGVGFLSGLSTDFFGDMLRDALTGSGVDGSLAVLSDRPTTLAFVRLVEGQASYAFYDENTAGRMLQPGDLPRLKAETQALFVGGISLISEPCGSAYEALLARESGRLVTMIDPNIRPGFVTDEAAYRARLERMIGKADIVKLSDEDLTWLVGENGGASADAQARAVLEKGPRVVFVTEGARGASAHTAEGRFFVPAQAVEVVDTVGAGDTFNAGVLAALQATGTLTKDAVGRLDGAVLEEALSLGVRAAAVTVSRAGANPPYKEEL